MPTPQPGGPEGCIVWAVVIAFGVLALLGAATLWTLWSERQGENRHADPRRARPAAVCVLAVRRLSVRGGEFADVRLDPSRATLGPKGPPPWEIACPIRLGPQAGELHVTLGCAGDPETCVSRVGPLILPGRHIILR